MTLSSSSLKLLVEFFNWFISSLDPRIAFCTASLFENLIDSSSSLSDDVEAFNSLISSEEEL